MPVLLHGIVIVTGQEHVVVDRVRAAAVSLRGLKIGRASQTRAALDQTHLKRRYCRGPDHPFFSNAEVAVLRTCRERGGPVEQILRLIYPAPGLRLIQRDAPGLGSVQRVADLQRQRIALRGEGRDRVLGSGVDTVVGARAAGERAGRSPQSILTELTERGVELLVDRTEPEQRLPVRDQG